MSEPVSIISQEEYKKLSSEEKVKYIEYNPLASDRAMASMIKQSSYQLEALDKLNPMYEKMKFVPNPLPGEQLEKLVSKIETMESMVDPIEKLASNKVVGVLARPLVSLINSVFAVIGQTLVLLVGVMKGTEFLTDSIIETSNQTDWDGIKETMDKATTFKKETKSNPETKEVKWDKIPSDKISSTCKEATDAVETCWASLKICDSSARVYKKVAETSLTPYSWKEMCNKLNKGCKVLGVNFDLLNRPTEDDMKKFEKAFPDPKKTGQKMSSKLNKLAQTKQYISIEDNNKLEVRRKNQTEYLELSSRLTELNKKYENYIHGTGPELTDAEIQERNKLRARTKELLTLINS